MISIKKLEFTEYIASYLTYNHSGYYTSSYLESFLVDYANTIECELNDINYRTNSFLHILTEGYTHGGHTRVVERWIKHAPQNQTHSVVITKHNNVLLNTLEQNVSNKHGEYICWGNNLSITERAKLLRKLAMKYQYVILHTHMNDLIPILALGTENFTRPVLLYNHASHLFWLGKSIADITLDIIKNDEITLKKRKIDNAYFLGVPFNEINYTKVDKREIRKKLNLPLDKKLIFTSGMFQKFRPICKENFLDYAKKIIDEDTYLYAIGIGKDNELWKNAFDETKGHIIPLDTISSDDGFIDYISCADLYLDSYPVGGGAAMIDAVSRGVPVLSLKSILSQLDYIMQTDAYCKSKSEFITKSKKILNDETYASKIVKEVQDSLLEYQSVEAWNKRIEKLLTIISNKHSIKDLSNEVDYYDESDQAVICNFLTNDKFPIKQEYFKTSIDVNLFYNYGNIYKKQGCPYVLEIISYKKDNLKTKVIKLFNYPIFKYQKNK